ncbi:MFS general substrate transporter [Penicillium pulvis]|uniref:MFS general substrate transporter n=1 Tax=Penicillium pulvis TaxID=1562058 RepID=UPI0025480870|nr:MFS general substrate transporter [Penicillium pulvis]KAJ5785989.1 MFS general substrate transporter [Penicillium pulvis]
MNSRPASIMMRETNVSREARSSQPNDSSSLSNPDVGNEDEDEVQYITGVELTLVILAVIGVALLIMLDMSIIATATPKITSDFHSTAGVGCCTLQPMSGKLYTRFNVKYTYIAFIALFELGSLVCGVSTSSNMLIVGRAIAGMGSSGVLNGAATILSASVPLEKRALYFGIVGSCGQIGVVGSPLIGGVLTEYATWRWCFYINLPIGGLAVLALLFISIPEHSLNRPEQQSDIHFASLFSDLDTIGFLLLSPTLVMFLLALEWGGATYPWNSTMVIALFCGSAGNLALFLTWEYKKGDAAMIPLKMIKQRVICSSSLTMFFLYANSLVTSYYLAIYFQGVRGELPMFSGVYMLPGIIAQMASGFLSGLAVQNNVPPSKIAVSVAFLYFCQTFGGALWLSFASTVFNAGLANLLPIYAPDVSFAEVTSAGVSGIRSVIPHSSLDGVIMAYNNAVQHVFYMVAGTATAAFVVSWGLGWKSVKKRRA